MHLKILPFVVFANLWIWKIFSYNFILGIILIIFTLLLLNKLTVNTIQTPSLIIILGLLLFFQYKTTDVRSLTVLSNDDIRVRDMRLKEYPPVKITLFNKTIWIPAAHWFEGRKESIAFFRILDNISEIVDPNLYFFANHPRERVGVAEFEKFPYLFLPFLVYGLFILAKEKKKYFWLILSAPLVLVAIIGSKNPIGPFSTFPFIGVSITFGIHKFLQKVPQKRFKKVVVTGVIFIILILLQMKAYGVS